MFSYSSSIAMAELNLSKEDTWSSPPPIIHLPHEILKRPFHTNTQLNESDV